MYIKIKPAQQLLVFAATGMPLRMLLGCCNPDQQDVSQAPFRHTLYLLPAQKPAMRVFRCSMLNRSNRYTHVILLDDTARFPSTYEAEPCTKRNPAPTCRHLP